MTDLSALLDQWDALAAGATEGPWRDFAAQTYVSVGANMKRRPESDGIAWDEIATTWDYADGDIPESAAPDAAFIAAARTGWPQAAAAIRAVLAMCEPERAPDICARDIRRALTDALTKEA